MYQIFYIENYNTGDIMISNYTIKNDTIILYLDYSFEIGSFDRKKVKDTLSNVLDYLKNTKIDIDGKKIMLMLGSTLVATLIYTGGTLHIDNSSNDTASEIAAIVENIDIKEENTENIDEKTEEKPKEESNIIEKSEENDENVNYSVKVDKEEASSNKTGSNKTTSNTSTSTTSSVSSSSVINNNTSKDTTKQESAVEEKKMMVTIYRSNGTVVEKELEEYIVGVVAAEMPASFNIEALKAQSVIVRTYTLKKLSRGEVLTDTVSTQAFIDDSEMKIKWGSDYSKYYNKIKSAVSATKGQYITYNGQYIDAVYHSTSNGRTEDAVNVWGNSIPYLKSVDSSWDKSASSYLKIDNKEFSTVMSILGIDISESAEINILSRNDSGRVNEVKIGDFIYSGVQFRNLLGLRSADFDISIENGQLVIVTRGYGHGVGMSQYGANGMANSGYNYKDIIKHYYTGVKIN